MALKWKPVALSPHTPQILGTFLSNSSWARVEVLTMVVSITEQQNTGEETEDISLLSDKRRSGFKAVISSQRRKTH